MKPLVILGDSMLDVDIDGAANRLCPEAPVPVVDVGREWQRPGGAGLAAMLAARSAPDVVLVTPLGDDQAGRRLAELIEGSAELVALPMRGSTVRKCRVRAAGQSLLRLDSGDGHCADAPLEPRVERVLRGAGAIVVADYGRGLTANPELRRLLARIAADIPVVWDPHPRGEPPVAGVHLTTPNESEARAFAGEVNDIGRIAPILRSAWRCDSVAVTVGSGGALFARNGRTHTVPVPPSARVPATSRPDTCGAGDRFATAAAAALLRGASTEEAVATAVESAARFVGAGGAASLSVCADPGSTVQARPRERGTASDVAERVRGTGGKLVATGGCFDLLHPGHVSLLRRARALGDGLIVCLNSDASVRSLKGPGRPIVPEQDRARLLLALEPVDGVVVFDEPSPAEVLDKIRPDVWVKGGDYADTDLPEASVVRHHGGEVVLVPLLGTYSTSGMVAAVSGNGGHHQEEGTP